MCFTYHVIFISVLHYIFMIYMFSLQFCGQQGLPWAVVASRGEAPWNQMKKWTNVRSTSSISYRPDNHSGTSELKKRKDALEDLQSRSLGCTLEREEANDGGASVGNLQHRILAFEGRTNRNLVERRLNMSGRTQDEGGYMTFLTRGALYTLLERRYFMYRSGDR